MQKTQRLIVIGGGIAGLAAARAAREEAGKELEILVLEREARVGGKATSHREDGWHVELGPTGFLDNEPALDRLVEVAGLAKLPARAAAAHRFLVRDGRMREIHAHPLKFLASGVLSPRGTLRLCAEPFVRRRVDSSDESVFEFAERRLGRQAAERLIAPMVLGVFAGDAGRLSLRSAFPRMAELEAEHGSLVKALIRLSRSKRKHGGPAGPSGALTSFAGGIEELPLALAERGGFEVRTNAEVEAIVHDPAADRWSVTLRGAAESVPADGLVLAGEAWSAAGLLAPLDEALARELADISCPHVSVVALGFDEEALRRVPTGFGALVQRGGPLRILGVLWDTHLFDGRSPDRRLLMRAMIGGAVDPDAASLSEDELLDVARRDVSTLFGLRDDPVFAHVRRWPRAIPQYELGHSERLSRIRARLARWNVRAAGLELAGGYLEGVAFGKAARSGMEAGRRAVRRMVSSVTGEHGGLARGLDQIPIAHS